MKVLVAEDNVVTLALLQATLNSAGFSVEAATDGNEALARVQRGDVRLVISDWEMPGLNGVDLCKAIRAMEIPGYVYVILVTAHDSTQDSVVGLSAGADDFIAKPFDTAELIARVRAGERILSLETREVAIFAMAKLAESRDPETGAHLERVRSYSRALAQQLAQHPRFRTEIDAEFTRLMYLTSPLHDIGKVGIPDSVLLKPGQLSDREFEIMKTHTTIGANTLEAALHTFPGVKFLEMARDIALTHHERVDGTGYPHGICGDSIPLCGRIVALADVYDALTSKRVYKPAFAHEVARSMIADERGAHFDPDVADAFLDIDELFVEIAQRFAESAEAVA